MYRDSNEPNSTENNYRSNNRPANSSNHNGHHNGHHNGNQTSNYNGNNQTGNYNGRNRGGNNNYSNNRSNYGNNNRNDNNRNNNYNNRSNNRNNNNNRSNNRNNDQNDSLTYDVKKSLIDFIYSKVQLHKYNYKMIEYESDLHPLKEQTYCISPNYTGINSLLVFKKIFNKYYSVLVDRKTLSYNQNNVDINKLKITPIAIRLDEKIYNGTIIDGVMLYGVDKGAKTFVVNDMYMFEGKNLMTTKIKFKMIQITQYLETYQKKDKYLNRLNIFPNKLYELSNTKHLINKYIPKCEYSKAIKGVAFNPEMSGTKLIYLYSNGSKDAKEEFIPGLQPKLTNVRVSNVGTAGLIKVFRMKKTEVIDVYELSLSYKVEQGGKKLLKFKKFGIAYIPTKECSYFCKDIFDSINNSSVLVECKYVAERDKWVPLKIAKDKKIPDNLEKVRETLKKVLVSV